MIMLNVSKMTSSMLEYNMADIFSLLKELNTSYQGKNSKQAKSIFIMYDESWGIGYV